MCPSVGDRISFFENLISSVDKKQNTSDKNATSNSICELRSGKVRKNVSKLTEIKQTPDETRVTVNNVQTNDPVFRTRKEKIKSEKTHRIDSKTTNNHINSPRKATKITSSTKVKKKIYDNPEIRQIGEKFGGELQNESSGFKEDDKEEEISNNNTINIVSFKDSEDCEDKVIGEETVFFKELDNEDIFGTNDFEENSEDNNYVVETYNRDGEQVIVIVTVQLTRRAISLNKGESDINHLIKYSNANFVYPLSSDDRDQDHEKRFGDDASIDNDAAQKPEKQEVNSYLYVDRKTGSSITERSEQLLIILNDVQPHKQYPQNFEHTEQGEPPSQERNENVNNIIAELLETEKNYICNLQEAVECYKPFLQRNEPHDLIGKSSYLFGNIEEIYEKSKTFLTSLETNCDTADGIAQVFIDSASTFFELYPEYSKNKPKADFYMKEFDDVIKTRKKQLLDSLGLASHLFTPIQRLGRYIMMLENIQKQLIKNKNSSEKINEAMEIIQQVMRKSDDMVEHGTLDLEAELSKITNTQISGVKFWERPKRSKNKQKRLNSGE